MVEWKSGTLQNNRRGESKTAGGVRGYGHIVGKLCLIVRIAEFIAFLGDFNLANGRKFCHC